MSREASLLAWLVPRLGAVGDDAAVVDRLGSDPLVLCSDAAVAGIHGDLGLMGLDDFGWKATVACLSDIAAMGAVAHWALVTVSGELGPDDFALLYEGIIPAAAEHGCEVVGGDITGGDQLVVSVAVVGSGGAPVRRNGAQPGDTVFVTGDLGASAGGLVALRAGRGDELGALVAAHRRPRPRLAEGQAAARAGATSMIDVSDGFGIDTCRLAQASGVGVEIDWVPVAAGLEAVTGDPLALALGGGEDYELVFTAPDPAAVSAEFIRSGLADPHALGRVTGDAGCHRLGHGELLGTGWEHG